MIVTLRTERIHTIEQVAAFVEANEPVDFRPADRAGAYAFVAQTLTRLDHHRLDKRSKALAKRYLAKTTGYSRAQLTRLIRQHRKTAKVVDRRAGNQRRPFARVYTPADVRLLARVDADLGQMSGLATRAVLHREYHVFGDDRFARLPGISASHIHNLRGSRTYRTVRTVVEGTKASAVSVGVRRAPQPQGMPGFLRVDTVHQGDRDGAKGVYLVNIVDEVTQYEYVGGVAGISERFLVPLLEALLALFPFVVVGFHADNGSEYINHTVAALLNKLHVRDFTKSRSRRSTDNALVEGKNANVVRRFLGHDHIPQRFAPLVDAFARDHPVALPQLPPAVPVRHRARGRQRPRQARLPGRGRPHALRQAALPRRCRDAPQARPALRRARRRGQRGERSAGGAGTQRRPPRTVPNDRGIPARCRLNTPSDMIRRRVFHRLPTAAWSVEGNATVDRPWKTLLGTTGGRRAFPSRIACVKRRLPTNRPDTPSSVATGSLSYWNMLGPVAFVDHVPRRRLPASRRGGRPDSLVLAALPDRRQVGRGSGRQGST